MFRKLAIQMACRKLAGRTVPAEGQSWDDVDCFSVELFSDDETRYLVERVAAKGYDTLKWTENRFQTGQHISFEDAKKLNIEVRRFYKSVILKYESEYGLLWGEVSLLPWRVRLSEMWSQRIYNLRTPTRHDRIQVLRRLIEYRIRRSEQGLGVTGRDQQGVSHIAVAQLIYGNRLFGHPICDRILSETEFLLDSLVDSGDAEISNGRYVVKGKALATIAAYEEAERRHRDQIRQSWVLAFLTFGLLAVGALQVWNSWGSSV
jgi:hypothetical protein